MINTQTKSSYAWVGIDKIKDLNSLERLYRHSSRIDEPVNADPNGDWGLAFGSGTSQAQQWKDRIKELGYESKKVKGAKHVKSNAVYGFEVVMTCPKTEVSRIDIEQWKKDNIKQLNETFNKNPEKLQDKDNQKWKEKDNNVAAVWYHGDEVGSVHMHAFIIPIDEKGHLNARGILNGTRDMRRVQDTWDKTVLKPHELKRGEKGTRSTHKHVTQLYASLEKAIAKELPPVRPSQSAMAYRKEANEVYKEASLQALGYKQKCEVLKEQVSANIREARAQARKEMAEEYGYIRERTLARTADQEFGSLEETYKAARGFRILEQVRVDDAAQQEFLNQAIEFARRKAEEESEQKRKSALKKKEYRDKEEEQKEDEKDISEQENNADIYVFDER